MRNTLLFILCSVICATSAMAGWKLESDKEGVKVYTRKAKGSTVRELKAITTLNASVDKATAILRHVKSATSWVPNLLVRRHVEDISDTEAVLYDVTDLPWPVTDRDSVAHYKLKLADDKKSLILRFNTVKRKRYNKTKFVRIKIHKGEIHFIPQGKKTKIIFYLLVDPRGGIPKWVVNLLQINIPHNFLKALDKYAAKTKIPTPKGIMDLINGLELK